VRIRHATLAIGSVLAVAIVVWVRGDAHRMALILGYLFSFFTLTIALLHIFRDERKEMFSPVVPVLLYLFLGIGLRGIANLSLSESRLDKVLDPTSPYFDQLMIRAFGIAILGTLFFLMGDVTGRRIGCGRFQFREPILSRRGSNLAMLTGILFLLAGGAPLLSQLGLAAFTNPAENAVHAVAGYFWTFPLMFGGIYGIVLSIAYRWSQEKSAGILRIAALVIVVVSVYMSTSSKAALIVPVLMLLTIRHLILGRISLKLVLLTPLSFFLMLPFLYFYRSFGFLGLKGLLSSSPEAIPFNSGWKLFFNRSYMIESLIASIHYTPQVFSYQFGKPWLEVFYFWIPRAFWPNKPYSQGYLFGKTYFSSSPLSGESFFAVSWLGDAYLNFGILGVPLLLFLLGLGLRFAYDFLGGSKSGVGGAFIFAAAFYHIAIGAEQSLAGFLTLMISYVGVAVVLLMVATLLSRPGSSSIDKESV
jgi:oligosaccharide repeat unit polymerase